MDVHEAGRKGGQTRAKNMTKKERSEGARNAALARHARRKVKRPLPTPVE